MLEIKTNTFQYDHHHHHYHLHFYCYYHHHSDHYHCCYWYCSFVTIIMCMPAKYPSTCDDYYQAGRTQSGVYLIDVDGHGPLDPVYVECAMGSQRDGHLYGATIVEHNFLFNTHVRGRLLEDRRYTLVYR